MAIHGQKWSEMDKIGQHFNEMARNLNKKAFLGPKMVEMIS